MSKWTNKDILDQTGKIAIVTGANGGIGYETARVLAQKGTHVVMACRNMTKGHEAHDAIKREMPDASIQLMHLDLASLDSIHTFVEAFKSEHGQLHLLINNAGVAALPEHRTTADGFEMHFGTNHLGHFALTGRLIDTIASTPNARVVTISSGSHHNGKIDFENLNAEQSYRRWKAYSQSKLANILFTHELQRKLDAAKSGAIAVAAHPGWTAAKPPEHLRIFALLNLIFAQKIEMGVLPTLYASTASDVQGSDYIGPDGFNEMRGYPTKVRANERSYDKRVASELWEKSESLTGVQYDILEANRG